MLVGVFAHQISKVSDTWFWISFRAATIVSNPMSQYCLHFIDVRVISIISEFVLERKSVRRKHLAKVSFQTLYLTKSSSLTFSFEENQTCLNFDHHLFNLTSTNTAILCIYYHNEHLKSYEKENTKKNEKKKKKSKQE